MFTDSHAHLDFKPLDREQQRVIDRAADAGVTRLINVSSNMEGARNAVSISSSYPNVYGTVGVHPHDADTLTPDAIEELLRLCAEPKIVAIGEIGLDYFRMRTPKETQQSTFAAQMDLASQTGKPVIIHSRDADADVLEILGRYPDVPGVVHFFSGSYETGLRLLDAGYHLGFTGVITFNRKSGPTPEEARRDVLLKEMPLDRILIETDSPFAAPEPYRGKPNEPAYVVEVARRIAKLRGLSLEDVGNATSENCSRLFHL